MSSGLISSYCAVAAAAEEQDPIGSANLIDRVLLFEMALPWRDEDRHADPQGSRSQQIRAVQRTFLQQHPDTAPTGHVYSYAIAPDPRWPTPNDHCRMIVARRPVGAFARYQVEEYLIPADQTLLEFTHTYYFVPQELSKRFAQWQVPEAPQTQVLICTHGSVDICCARLGVPLYMAMARTAPELRVWRAMHFGGHRFAPTAWDLGSGYKWAFLDETSLLQIAAETGEHLGFAAKMRGWHGVPAPVQLLDREGFREHGWRWLEYRRSGVVLASNPEAQTWEVSLSFETPEGVQGIYEATVGISRRLPDPGCGLRWGSRPEATSPEYTILSLR